MFLSVNNGHLDIGKWFLKLFPIQSLLLLLFHLYDILYRSHIDVQIFAWANNLSHTLLEALSRHKLIEVRVALHPVINVDELPIFKVNSVIDYEVIVSVVDHLQWGRWFQFAFEDSDMVATVTRAPVGCRDLSKSWIGQLHCDTHNHLVIIIKHTPPLVENFLLKTHMTSVVSIGVLLSILISLHLKVI